MNWSAIAAVCSLFGVVATIVGVAFTSGRLTEKIRENKEKVDGHGVLLVEHGSRLNDHDVELAKLNEWKNGYNAAARVSGKQEVSY